MLRPLPPFEKSEFEGRVARAQELMAQAGLDAVLATSEHNFRYFTGDIGQSPYQTTRPRCVLIPARGLPVALVARGIDEALKDTTWITQVLSWPGPNPADEGVSAIVAAICDATADSASIGIEMGPESRLGLPLADFMTVAERIGSRRFVDAQKPVFIPLKQTKSAGEIARIRRACGIVSDAFETLPEHLALGDTEWDACRKMEALCFEGGVDKAPKITGISDHGGHIRTFAGPTRRVLGENDLMFIDAGCTVDFYWCDFNRHFAFGSVDPATAKAYDLVWAATQAGIDAARPGVTASDVWHAMNAVIARENGAGTSNSFGRMGHSMGMTTTELPSLTADDHTVLVPGMTLNIEPSTLYESHFDGSRKLMVHEEDVVVTESGCEVMTRRAPLAIPVITRRSVEAWPSFTKALA